MALTVKSNTLSYPGKSSGECRNGGAFAAIKSDGSVITWGGSDYGGNSSAVANALNGMIDVRQIYSTSDYYYTMSMSIQGNGAFAALRANGSVITWGKSYSGGEKGIYVYNKTTEQYNKSSDISAQLNGTIDVTQIYSTGTAFAALRADGSVVTWGNATGGGDSSSVASKLNGTIDVTQIYSTKNAFAAVRADGSVITWGDYSQGGDKGIYAFNNTTSNFDKKLFDVSAQLDGAIDVTQIYSTSGAFAAVRADGSVVTWGISNWGGDSSSVASKLNGTIDVTQIYSTETAFAAVRVDGSVITWGVEFSGGYSSSSVAGKLDGTIDITHIYSTGDAFAALRADGSVVTWGSQYSGGDSAEVASKLNGIMDVTQIYSTSNAFAALREDGSVVTWGESIQGGDSSAVASQLNGTIDVTQIYSTGTAFAVLRADGSVVTWGDLYFGNHGGDSSAVTSQLDGTIDVVQIYATSSAFAAVRADGSVVTWGDASYGGDSSSVASKLSSGVISLATPYTNDVYFSNEPKDTIAPNATITLNKTSLGIGATAKAVIKFSEEVSAFNNTDLTIIGGTLSTLTSTDNITWTGTFTPTANSTTAGKITLNANGYSDAMGNKGSGAISGGITINTLKISTGNDNITPTASINTTLDGLIGTDTLAYSKASQAITVDLSKTSVQDTGFGKHIIKNIENLTGSNYNDTLIGNTVDNILNGGTGNDQLTGGAGKDTFKFDTTPSTTNLDTITDFSVKDDTIQLENAIFKAFGTKTGTIATSNFVKNTTGKAVDKDDYIIYETDTGKVFYDADGSDKGAGVQVALIGKNLVLTNAYFVLI